MMQLIRNLMNGMIIGSSMLLPGVSGGSMAIILGVYDRLILSVSNLLKDFRRNFSFLFIYALGGSLGILLFSKALLHITTVYEQPMMFLFLGAVAGSIPLLLKKAKLHESGFQRINLAYAAFGFLLVYFIEFLPENLFTFTSSLQAADYLTLLIIGIILSVALVLPGISFSYMLLVLGIYQPALTAIEQFHIPFLAALGGGVLLGIILTTKLLGVVMERHPTEAFLLIIGFVLSTMREIYPGLPDGRIFLPCFLLFAAGLSSIYILSKQEQ